MERVARSLEGSAWLLEAEDRNCILLNNAASCILPIAPEAVHRDRAATLEAIRSFDGLVTADPSEPEAIWLLNLAHMLAGSYPEGVPPDRRIPAERFASETTGTAPPLMMNLSPALGVDIRDLAGGAVRGARRVRRGGGSQPPCSWQRTSSRFSSVVDLRGRSIAR